MRTPRWVRQVLLAADSTTLVRAEGTLAAMIGTALRDDEMASAIEPAGVG